MMVCRAAVLTVFRRLLPVIIPVFSLVCAGCGLPPTFKAVSAQQAEVYVCETGSDEHGDGTRENPYATLGKAVQQAAPGGCIYVFPGRYSENVVLNSPVTITGLKEPDEEVMIAAADGAAPLITVNTSAYLSELTLTGAGGAQAAAIRVQAGSRLQGSGLVLEDSNYGLYAEDASLVSLQDCSIRNATADGLYVSGGGTTAVELSSVAIRACGGDGLRARGSGDANRLRLTLDLQNATLQGNAGGGINLRPFVLVEAAAISGSLIENNGGDGLYLAYLDYESAVTLENNTWRANGGCGMDLRAYPAPSNNTVVSLRGEIVQQNNLSQSEYAVYLQDAGDVRVIDTVIENNNNSGLNLERCPVVGVNGCRIASNSGYGMGVQSWETVTVAYNIFTGNTHQALRTDSALHAPLNYWGDPSGPRGGPAGGQGDEIADNVAYGPWLGCPVGAAPMVYCLDDSERTVMSINDTVGAASGGDCIVLLAGRYEQNLLLDKSVTLAGEGLEQTILTAPGGSIVTVSADGASVQGLALQRGETDAGITLTGGAGTFTAGGEEAISEPAQRCAFYGFTPGAPALCITGAASSPGLVQLQGNDWGGCFPAALLEISDQFSGRIIYTPYFDGGTRIGALQITTARLLPGGRQGRAYAAQLSAAGGSGAYSWSVEAGQLPAGLQLDAAGMLSGIPRSSGWFSFTVAVEDEAGEQATRELALHVQPSSATPADWLVWRGEGGGYFAAPPLAQVSAALAAARGSYTLKLPAWLSDFADLTLKLEAPLVRRAAEGGVAIVIDDGDLLWHLPVALLVEAARDNSPLDLRRQRLAKDDGRPLPGIASARGPIYYLAIRGQGGFNDSPYYVQLRQLAFPARSGDGEVLASYRQQDMKEWAYLPGSSTGEGGLLLPLQGPAYLRLDRYLRHAACLWEGDILSTALNVSRWLYPREGSAGAVVLTTESYADTLAAIPLARAHNAPLLITPPSGLWAPVAGELQRVLKRGATVYMVGGEQVLPARLADEVAALGYAVRRLGGSDRYATAAAVARAIAPGEQALLANGACFPDLLTAAAVSGGAPLLYTRASELPAPTRAYLAEQPPLNGLIAVGGPAVISEGVAASAGAARRLGGSDRYATALAAAAYFQRQSSTVVLACTHSVEHALVGAIVADRLNYPFYLVDTRAPQAYLQDLIGDEGITRFLTAAGKNIVLESLID